MGCELPVASNGREVYPEIDSSRNLCAFLHPRRDKPDVVRIGNDANTATTLKRDIKFARKIIKIPIVENIVVQRFGIWLRIDDLSWIDSGGLRSSNVSAGFNPPTS